MSLKICDITFSYSNCKTQISNITAGFAANSRTAIIGPNGSGKSTLLRLIANLLTPASGHIELDGRNLTAFKRIDLAKHIAFMKQNPEVPSGFTVRELTACGRYPHSGAGKMRNNDAVEKALADSGAAPFAERRLNTLSGGELQKAFLAMALAQETEILLLDEPASALDPAAGLEFFSLLDKLQQERSLTIIFVSHDLNLALRRCDRIIGLKEGKMLFCGSPEEAEKYIPQLYDLPEELFSRSADGKLCLL